MSAGYATDATRYVMLTSWRHG